MNIREAKDKLPLPQLLTRLNLDGKIRKSTTCPIHEENQASFGLYTNPAGEIKWKCFAGCGQGDQIDFLMAYWKIDKTEAVNKFIEMAQS